MGAVVAPQGSPVPAALGHSHIPEDTPCPAGGGGKHLLQHVVMLPSGSEAGPSSRGGWQDCFSVRHRSGFTGGEGRLDPRQRCRSIGCRPQTSLVHLGHPPCPQTLTHPHGFSPAPEQLPRPPSSGTILQATSSSAAGCAQAQHHVCPQHPLAPRATSTRFAPGFPVIPWGCTSPELLSAAPMQCWEEQGARNTPE